MTQEIKDKLKNFLIVLRGFFLWLMPLAIFLLFTYLPKVLWNTSFKDYLDFLKIIIWPYTVLVIIFFFKKVFTYLFFSIEGFDFFGINGTLKNVNTVISEHVDKKFLEEKNGEKTKVDMEKLKKEIEVREKQISIKAGEVEGANVSAEKNLKLAGEILKEWKESAKKNEKIITDLYAENKKLKDALNNLPPVVSEINSASNIDDSKTSNPIKDESNINK